MVLKLVDLSFRGQLGGIRARNRDVFNVEVVRNVFEGLIAISFRIFETGSSCLAVCVR